MKNKDFNIVSFILKSENLKKPVINPLFSKKNKKRINTDNIPFALTSTNKGDNREKMKYFSLYIHKNENTNRSKKVLSVKNPEKQKLKGRHMKNNVINNDLLESLK